MTNFYPTVLHGLTPREAVADSVFRMYGGLDHKNKGLFSSAVAQDFAFVMDNGQVFDADTLYNWGITKDTTHLLMNMRVNVLPGANTATVTGTGMAQHHHPNKGMDLTAPYLLGGGFHEISVVKDNTVKGAEVWRIQKWDFTRRWLVGDAGVLR